jgi:acyl CoA:acetate/3-ketoacid CoA transferase beta subunit
MHTTVAVAAVALIGTGLGVWASSPTNVRVPSIGPGVQVETFQLMTNAKDLPTAELVDYTFVF